ncbi:MAG TPA: glucose 1-dehydrogenase [Thermoanaerobaculia bacterium]|nr:glucose 1-dehydrogenase [Thermoanaerobaculia bacterium]
MRFEGKVALVTGGNSGIGLATAKALAAEGARVVITGRDEETLRKAAQEIGHEALAVQADVTKLPELASVMERIRERHGRVDVLFANAGVAKFFPASAATEEAYDLVMDTNVKGVYFTIQQALPLLAPGGAVVINSSIAGVKGMPAGTVYGATKAAVRSLGRSFAAELLERNVRVNVVSPGPIDTPIYTPTPGLKERFTQNVPMKRAGTADEVAKTVLFLASDDASYINGAELAVDGGMAAL